MAAEAESILWPRWPAPARVRAACTTRIGGHSQGPWASFNLGERVGDAPAAVAANQALLTRQLALPGAPQWLHQVHGTDLVAAADDGLERRGDAGWARRPGLVCAVRSADCLPVLLCDRDATCVAALHGGWRGLAAGIIPRTLAALPLPPGRWLAWLGPAICGSCYEVGEDVRAAFARALAGLAGPGDLRILLRGRRGRPRRLRGGCGRGPPGFSSRRPQRSLVCGSGGHRQGPVGRLRCAGNRHLRGRSVYP